MSVTLYHNPRCSKSRETLKLLQDRGVEPAIVEYLKTPPDAAKLRELLGLLGMAPRQLLRKGEAPFQELELANPELDDEALIAAMASHPVLIERPIVVANGKAALGRPPENVLAILD